MAKRFQISLAFLLFAVIPLLAICVLTWKYQFEKTSSEKNPIRQGLLSQLVQTENELSNVTSKRSRSSLHLHIAYLNLRLGREEAAEGHWALAREADPADYGGNQFAIDFAVVHAANGNYARSIQVFEQIISECADSVRARTVYAHLLATSKNLKVRDPKRAITLAEEIIASSDASYIRSNEHALLAEALASDGQFEAAIARMEFAIEKLKTEYSSPGSEMADYLNKIQQFKQGRSTVSHLY